MDTLRDNHDKVVSAVDIFPTVLRLWDQPIHPHLDGVDLLSPVPPDRVALCFGAASWAEWFPPSIGVATHRNYIHHRQGYEEPVVFDVADSDIIRFDLHGEPLTAEDLHPHESLGSLHPLVEHELQRFHAPAP